MTQVVKVGNAQPRMENSALSYRRTKRKKPAIWKVLTMIMMVMNVALTATACQSRLTGSDDSLNRIFLSADAAAWSWNYEKARTSLKTPLMHDMSPEFSKDGLEWTHALEECVDNASTSAMTVKFERLEPTESFTADMVAVRAVMEGAIFKNSPEGIEWKLESA